MQPNLWETLHPFTDPNLAELDVSILFPPGFHALLKLCSLQFTYSKDTPYMPLTVDQVPSGIGPSFKLGDGQTITYPFDPYSCTIPASIQY